MLRLEVLSILGSVILLAAIFELVRSRRLKEKYSLLWLLTAVVLVVFAASKGLRLAVSHAMGMSNPPLAFFLLAFLFLMLITLQFSIVISRLSARNKALAHELTLLKVRVNQLEGEEGQSAEEFSDCPTL